ncbi:MAG: DUF4345 family protein [Calditrichia bacterium]
MEIFKIVVLFLSGLMLSFAGMMRLITPIKAYFVKTYLENSGIKLEDDVDMLNEIRGVSAVLVLGGIIILLGTIIPEIRLTSFIVAVLIFLGFAIGRSLSLGLDGKPNQELVQGTTAEIIFSVVNVFCLVHMLS